MRRVSSSLVVVGLFVLCAISTFAATIHVPDDYPTIHEGVAHALDGDTVLVRPGSYLESVFITGKRVAVISTAGPDSTIVRSVSDDPTFKYQDDLPRGSVLEGFTISNGNRGGVQCINSAVVVRGNVIEGNRGLDTRTGGGIDIIGTHGCLIEWNVITANSSPYGPAIHVRNNAENDTIRHNLIYGNWGIGDIRIHGSATAVLNNTIVVSEWSGILSQVGGTVQAHNNIVVGAPQFGIQAGSDAMVSSSYNCTYANNVDYGGVIPGEGAVYQDPQFFDPPNHMYYLIVGSPCVDVADPDTAFNDPDCTSSDNSDKLVA